jgi:hypothetical protein
VWNVARDLYNRIKEHFQTIIFLCFGSFLLYYGATRTPKPDIFAVSIGLLVVIAIAFSGVFSYLQGRTLSDEFRSERLGIISERLGIIEDAIERLKKQSI